MDATLNDTTNQNSYVTVMDDITISQTCHLEECQHHLIYADYQNIQTFMNFVNKQETIITFMKTASASCTGRSKK